MLMWPNKLREMLKDNGFSSTEELFVYRKYSTKRIGCNLEDRFVIRSGEENAVHCEYEMLDLVMEVAHGPVGRRWKLVRQELETSFEPSQDGDLECPYYVDILTIRLPGRPEEKYYFDVTAWYLSVERFLPGGEFYEDIPESKGDGFKESVD